MSLPQEPVFSKLKQQFVVGWKNIAKEDYVGASHGYTCDQTAVGTTNGAGPRNIQMFILASDGTVLHCLPGFWHPDDLAHELEFGRVMNLLWKDSRSKKNRREMFAKLQLRAARRQPKEMKARSGWQGFDASNERKRLEHGPRDTFYTNKDGTQTKLKPISVLLHERMATRPFVKISKFDTEAFIDYGRSYYDNNARVDGKGVQFGSKGYMASQQRMAERKAKRLAKKAKVDAYYGKKPAATKDSMKMAKKQQPKKKTRKKKSRKPTSRPTSRPTRN